MKIDYRQEFARLYDVEYHDWPEVVFRLAGVFLGSVMLYIYSGWMLAWVWSGGYLALHALHFIYLQRKSSEHARRDCHIAGGLFIAVLIAFIWMPAYMTQVGDVSLTFIGSTLIATTLAYMIRRADTMMWMVVAESVTLAVALGVAVIPVFEQIQGRLALLACVIVCVAVVLYMFQAILITRRSRLLAEDAAVRMAQEQKMAAIGQLAGGVAHDFNNILTAIIGNLELYAVVPDDERETVIQEAHASAKRAEAVVSHLLIYARKAPVNRRLLDLNEALAGIRLLAERSTPAAVAQHWDLPGPSAQVRVDEVQLTTAVINLVRNAVDAMNDQGTLRVETRTETVETPRSMADGGMLAPGRYAALTITDSGPGIPEAQLSKVIEPFYTTKPVGKGTGLGLSMVLGFARDSKGGLEIGNCDSGARVTVYLPCA
ncbi:sensor histidine kinase [Tropicibacter naphthalenivorans]|uniref:histidine kinase n=1 Tax=Tropicibacter naphthalenivorans TaxID=441103 RepID=A0A0P1GGH7_9RHOB|nr:ATP-binding protein [Tropicibacter naphthalenivorans]CUH74795.1 Blue-light-activated protein [Tropicibacter naphthalenivorans]SMC48916.1 His Kinase A (phospho-acceptor) domain-containing protein [Tropicibacter naphthalenivorans]